MTTLSDTGPAGRPRPGGDPPPFGQSLHVDFYGVSKELCDDLTFCYALLDGLVEHLGMHKQAPPFLFRSPDAEYPDKAGLSGWVPLIESGISLHTLSLKGFVTIDLYTCGCLDVERTVGYLSGRLGSGVCERHHLIRGRRYHV